MSTITLDGIVGVDITPATLREQLIGAGDLDIRLHSPGGDVHDGIAVHNLLRDHRRAGHRVSITVTGLAASMATYIAMASDEIRVEDNAVWMIHNPWTFVLGDYRDMRKSGDILDALTRVLGNAYAARTGQPLDAVRRAMDDETWLYGADIVAEGWADVLIPAGDGPETPDDALALARTAFGAMSRTMRERASTETLALDRIAALLQPNPLESAMNTANHAADRTEPLDNPSIEQPETPSITDTTTARKSDGADLSPESIEARVQAAIAAERRRAAAIQARCAEVGRPELAAALIESGATMADCNAAIIDAWVAQGGPEIRQTTTLYPAAQTSDWSDIVAEINARRA